jgi:receptor protein-tyrosine kinase
VKNTANLIEEATKRLQQLEKAGIEVPGKPEPAAPGRHEADPSLDPLPSAARAAQVPLRAHPSADAAASGPNFRKIDLARLEAAGFITPSVADSKLLHEFRIIKRPLIQNALRSSAGSSAYGNLIMVTSSLPGEGKSFVALNLAMSIAMEVDTRVLLVDADVIGASIPRLLGIAPAKGLLDVLIESDLGFGNVLLKTNVDRLALVLAGTPHRGASELLASDAMTALLKEVSSRYSDRIVVFDSPPLLATTESRVLARRMGQVVLVVEAGRTTHGTLESALATVESCPIVLTVLNKATHSDAGAYYGYYGPG